MEHLGYGSQPYFVYKHADIDRVHFHIVSTRIDRHTGKKIKDNYEKDKVQTFIKEMEQTYKLTNDIPTEKINLKFTAYSKNLKQNLENLFKELNRMDFITSKQMYSDALKLFHIEIRPANQGHLIFVTDGNGTPIRHPIKMSDIDERPKFYLSEQQYLSQNYKQYLNSDQIGLGTRVLKSLVLKELFRRMSLTPNKFQLRKYRKLKRQRQKWRKY